MKNPSFASRCSIEKRRPSFDSFDHSFSQSQRVSVIRDELVALTGNHFTALVLNQLLYWTQRVKDFDLYLEEERILRALGKEEGSNSNVQDIPQHGWIYKTANELIQETLLCVNRTTMRRYLNFLIEKGWIEERTNPSNKWDKTTQYRINLRKIQEDLLTLGLTLPECCLREILERISPIETAENSNGQNAHSKEQKTHSKELNALSKVQNARSYTYTEITTETTNREHTPRARDFQKDEKEEPLSLPSESEFFEKVLALWKTHVGQDVNLTESRKHKLSGILRTYFQNDLSQWELFCQRIGTSSFLMGEGQRKWRVSLDWILVEDNLLKVLEGNFDDPTLFKEQKTKDFKKEQEQRFQEILDSIEDPVWKYWCCQLAFPPSGSLNASPLSISELEALSPAKFLEVESSRLVWIGSSDQVVLNKIESLRLALLYIVQKTFPHARNIRTRLLESEDRAQKTMIRVPKAIVSGKSMPSVASPPDSQSLSSDSSNPDSCYLTPETCIGESHDEYDQ
jgi:DNA-binding MarR family transcriptional regulator